MQINEKQERPPQRKRKRRRVPSVSQIMTQGASKKRPKLYSLTPEGETYVDFRHESPRLPAAGIRELVGRTDADELVRQACQNAANMPHVVSRYQRLSAEADAIDVLLSNIDQMRVRLQYSDDRIPKRERYEIGRIEKDSKGLSLEQTGQGVAVAGWATMFTIGIAAEIATGYYNINRSELEGMSWPIALLTAYLPFIGTFGGLKFIDPADVDRYRPKFYTWLTRLTLVCTPASMWLFASKLDANLEASTATAGDSSGPSFTLVIWFMQMCFAIAIYLTSVKCVEAYYRFMGYDIRKTREHVDICDDLDTCDDVAKSLKSAKGRIEGSMAAIEARAQVAVSDGLLLLAKFTRQDRERRDNERKAAERLKDRADAAAAKARFDALGGA